VCLLSLGSFILDLCHGRREHKIVKLGQTLRDILGLGTMCRRRDENCVGRSNEVWGFFDDLPSPQRNPRGIHRTSYGSFRIDFVDVLSIYQKTWIV